MASSNPSPEQPVTAITWDVIVAAHQRIKPRIHRTPVLTSSSIDALAGAQLFFKCDNFQKTGSFKIRGATNAVFSLTDEEARRGVVCHSSGNHAAALACAAAWRGIPAWIVMPRNAPGIKCRAVESYGGKITFCEPTVSSRNEVAARLQQETGAVMIHPFDNDRIVAGQATAAKELLEEIPNLDAILTPVSGGGLLSGTSVAAKSMRPQIKVYGCEPELADDAFRSLQTGILQSQESSATIADGLRASLSPRTFAIIRKNVDGIVTVSEEEIISAAQLVWERMKIIVEPSSSVPLAPLMRPGGVKSLALKASNGSPARIGIIFSGGNVELPRPA
jgi:threonine dehydratase